MDYECVDWTYVIHDRVPPSSRADDNESCGCITKKRVTGYFIFMVPCIVTLYY